MKKNLLLLIVTLTTFNTPLSTLLAQTINIMSYNIRSSTKNEQDGVNSWENRKQAAVKMLLAERPDVVGMQEEMPDQEAYLREHLAPLYDAVSVSRDPNNREDEACAIFYRTDKFDLVGTNTFWLSETPDVPSRGWDGKYKRIVTYVHVRDKKSGQLYLVFNTHLDHKGGVAREKSLALIADSAIAIGGDTIPMFVMGDLNVTPDAPELTPMWQTMQLAQYEAPVTDPGMTFHSWGRGKGKMIDYIFFRKASALEFRILRDGYGVPFLSDHYPIIAVFTPMQISKDAYNTVLQHNKTVRTRNNRQKDWARFEYYAAQNDSILAAKAKTTVVFYGNSITRNWSKMRRQFFTDNGFTGRGIGGQTSAELLVRMRQDVIDLHPKTVVIMCGTNDIARNNGTISIDHTLGNIISMCELAKANKIRPVLCSVLPARSFRWNPFVYDAPAQIRELNAKIRAYAERNKITYVDYYSAMVDADGGLKAGLSNDEVHPTEEGYKMMEPIILHALKKGK